jgi:hypothetical protein
MMASPNYVGFHEFCLECDTYQEFGPWKWMEIVDEELDEAD